MQIINDNCRVLDLIGHSIVTGEGNAAGISNCDE